MKEFVLTLLIGVSAMCPGQKTVEVEKQFKDSYAVYTQLKKKPYTKHGAYKLYRKSDGVLLEDGAYDMGKQVGTWSYYGYKGALHKQYDFATGKITFYDPTADTATVYIREKGELNRVVLDWPVDYEGGVGAVGEVIRTNVSYPEYAREMGISGTVYVGFYVSVSGTAIDHFIEKGVDKLLDDEALRIVKLIPDKWTPAKYQGKLVETRYVIPISFRIA